MSLFHLFNHPSKFSSFIMPIISIENWSLRPVEGSSTTVILNAWVGPATHTELQTQVTTKYHTGKSNWGKPSHTDRIMFFEYTFPLEKANIKPCTIVDGWYFTISLPTLEEYSFTLSFEQRKQNPRYPIASREEITQKITI